MRPFDLSPEGRRAIDDYLVGLVALFGAESILEVVAGQPSASPLAGADLVVCRDVRPRSTSRHDLERLAASARKVLVVFTGNGERVGAPSSAFRTCDIAPLLWAVGRVRDHAYFGLPAPVAALVRWRRGGDLPGVLHAPVPTVVSRSAQLHAFVVDTTPRTPQARRRLRTMAEAREAGS